MLTIRKNYSEELFETYYGLKGYMAASAAFNEYYRCFALDENRGHHRKKYCASTPSARLQETYDKNTQHGIFLRRLSRAFFVFFSSAVHERK